MIPDVEYMCKNRGKEDTPYEVFYIDFDMEDFCCWFEPECDVWNPADEYSSIIPDDFCAEISVPDDFCSSGKTSKDKLCFW